MNIKVILLFITINMLLFAQYTSTTNNNILVNTGEGRVDYTTYTIYADATADFLTDTRLHHEALLILQQQAEEETMKTLYDILGNIPIDNEDTIYSIMEENRFLKEKVVTSINNARLVGISYPTRTSVKVLMALDITTNNLLSDLINNINIYKPNPIVTYFDTGTDYDSLVIDARNIGFIPSLFPTVYDEDGNEIYNIAYINKAVASTNGYITYSTNSFLTNQNITNIVGSKPYNIVAWRTRGRLSSDLVIGNEDASIIMSSRNLKNAIKNCKVIFIID
ncbi:hypothetical protein [uncultured Brachyspira sp.]|uniref:hypothetical protein n=1 Tax=uncultured Brachyspira sp. TaxID=221953 RepID=UPI0025CF5157|nr:hypothetical protein [uncultured Brachyspira sp.]